MSENLKGDHARLFELILGLKTQKDCEDFFSDLCTYKELDSMSARVKAAELLIKGETYEKIISTTDISSATLSRVSKCVKYGDGYRRFLSADGDNE